MLEMLTKVGAALHAAEPEISKDGFLHPVIKGILLMMTSGLEPNELASVLATSGNPDDEISSRQKNSYHCDHLVASFCSQWSDDAILKRDKGHRKQRAQANAITELQQQVADHEEAMAAVTEYDNEDKDSGLKEVEFIAEGQNMYSSDIIYR